MVDDGTTTLIAVDRLRFERILANLLQNAEVHADGPVRITIGTTVPGSVDIAVEDAGPGVDESEREHVFERFARGATSLHRVGTGLGLALVSEHTNLLGGSTWVEARPGGGARFVVRLPEPTPIVRRRHRGRLVTRPTRAWAAVVVGAVVLAVGLGACGVGTTSHVEEISPVELARAVPSTTVSEATSEPVAATASIPGTPASAAATPLQVTTTTVPVTTTTAPPEPFTAYFVEGSELIPLTVDVPAGSRLRRQLQTLEDGLTPAELATGVRTAVTPDLIDRVLIGVSQVTVDLEDSQFDAMEPSEQLLLVAQIVLTLTGDLRATPPSPSRATASRDASPARTTSCSNRASRSRAADYESMLANPETQRSVAQALDPVRALLPVLVDLHPQLEVRALGQLRPRPLAHLLEDARRPCRSPCPSGSRARPGSPP